MISPLQTGKFRPERYVALQPTAAVTHLINRTRLIVGVREVEAVENRNDGFVLGLHVSLEFLVDMESS